MLALRYLYLTKLLLSGLLSTVTWHLVIAPQMFTGLLTYIRALRHIRPSLTEDMAITVAISMVHSRLDYHANSLFTVTQTQRLQSLHNSAARVVLKDNHNLSSGDLLRKLHWLPVQSRIEFKIACITYKVLTTGQPSYISNLLNHYTPPHTLRSANQYLVQQQWVCQEVVISHLKFWNNIPLNIRLCSTLSTLKHHLKT